MYTYITAVQGKRFVKHIYVYIYCISSTNNDDDVTRQYNYVSFQEAGEIDNLKYTTINMYKICVLHVITY